MAIPDVWVFRLCTCAACFLVNVLLAIHRCSIANEAVRGGLDFYLVFLVVFCFRCFGGYRRLASATLMTLTDMLFSRCLSLRFVVAASSLRRLYQRGTLPCPRLGGDAALPGTPLLMQDQHCIL